MIDLVVHRIFDYPAAAISIASSFNAIADIAKVDRALRRAMPIIERLRRVIDIELADGRVRPTGGQGTARSTCLLQPRSLTRPRPVRLLSQRELNPAWSHLTAPARSTHFQNYPWRVGC